MKHIVEYSYATGQSFNGFRVHILKNGIEFRKYISSKKIGRDGALKEAIRVEKELANELKKYNTLEELIQFKNKWS